MKLPRLTEILKELPRRYKKLSPGQEILQVFADAKAKDIELYVQYSDIEKLGINPQTEHGTPVGIYSYPAEDFTPGEFIAGSLPYAADRKYLVFFTVKP